MNVKISKFALPRSHRPLIEFSAEFIVATDYINSSLGGNTIKTITDKNEKRNIIIGTVLLN